MATNGSQAVFNDVLFGDAGFEPGTSYEPPNIFEMPFLIGRVLKKPSKIAELYMPTYLMACS